jgi:hypothetical protein
VRRIQHHHGRRKYRWGIRDYAFCRGSEPNRYETRRILYEDYVARSRHIILHERSASAASFGICTGPDQFQILAQCTVWWPACGRNDVSARGIARWCGSLPAGVRVRPPAKARACAISRVQGIRGPRYAPAPVSTPLVVTLRAYWWGAALARDGLHQLHGLPTCGTADHSWRRRLRG